MAEHLPVDMLSAGASRRVATSVGYLLSPAALARPCELQMPISVPNGTALGSWGICCAALPPPHHPCLALSVGIGGEWTLEDALADAGCEVHAMDPTEALHAAHAAHAAGRNGITFHFVGVRAAGQTRLPYGGLNPDGLMTLEQLVSRAQQPHHHHHEHATTELDVLKLDCEGCEWEAFSRPTSHMTCLVSRVRILMIELHLTPAFGFHNVSQLDELLDLIAGSGLELYRRRFNPGFKKDKRSAPLDLVRGGFPSIACCVELHFSRRSDLVVLTSATGGSAGATDHQLERTPSSDAAALARCNRRPRGREDATGLGSSRDEAAAVGRAGGAVPVAMRTRTGRFVETNALFRNERVEAKYRLAYE